MLPQVSQAELGKAMIAFLENHPEHGAREDVERAQMLLATPGGWEAAKVEMVPGQPDTETTE